MNLKNWSIEYIQWWTLQNLEIELYYLEDYKVQPRKLKIIFSRYIKDVTNINYPLFLYEEVFLSFYIYKENLWGTEMQTSKWEEQRE